MAAMAAMGIWLLLDFLAYVCGNTGMCFCGLLQNLIPASLVQPHKKDLETVTKASGISVAFQSLTQNTWICF